MKKCMICKNHGKQMAAEVKDVIYHPGNETTFIHLCYSHSVELFKTGQTNFVLKYKPESVVIDYGLRDVVNPLSNYFTFSSFR